MVEISLSGSGEGPGRATGRGYSTARKGSFQPCLIHDTNLSASWQLALISCGSERVAQAGAGTVWRNGPNCGRVGESSSPMGSTPDLNLRQRALRRGNFKTELR